jgi:hypothetical protein
MENRHSDGGYAKQKNYAAGLTISAEGFAVANWVKSKSHTTTGPRVELPMAVIITTFQNLRLWAMLMLQPQRFISASF